MYYLKYRNAAGLLVLAFVSRVVRDETAAQHLKDGGAVCCYKGA